MLTLAFNPQPVKATGTIYIRADGIVEGTTYIQTADNVTYMFAADINDSIIIQRNSIVIDGNGYTIQDTDAHVTGIDLSDRTNVTVKNTQIRGFNNGILLYSSSSNSIYGNNVANNHNGIVLNYSSKNIISGNNATGYGGESIWLSYSSNNTISGNNITENNGDTIVLDYSSNNTISGNNITTNNWGGIVLISSSNNIISTNNVANNPYGLWFEHSSSSNMIYHNNFIDNIHQASSDAGSMNTWDNGYPSGGNYWGSLNAADEDKDKIGDSPYIIDENNTDKYPLIYPYEFYQPGYEPKHDINNDGTVNIIDVAIVARAFGCKPGDSNWNPAADMDINEIINIIDVAKVAKDYGNKL
jgi:parallel beta-helix repeat protein